MIRPLLILAALAPATAAAQVRYQDTTAIDVAVQAFTGQPIGAEGGARTAVDTRLKLAACPLPQLDWRAASQDAVVVTCDAPRWRIFVPVKMPPQAARAPVVAAASAPAAAPAAAKAAPPKGALVFGSPPAAAKSPAAPAANAASAKAGAKAAAPAEEKKFVPFSGQGYKLQ